MLLFSWRESLQAKLLTVVMLVSAVWSALAAAMAFEGSGAQVTGYKAFEIFRYVAWYVFLIKLFDTATTLRGEG